MTFRSRRKQTCGLVRRHAANNNTRNDSRNAVLLVPFITGRRPPTSSSLLAWRRQRRARPDYEKRLEGARAIANATAEQHSLGRADEYWKREARRTRLQAPPTCSPVILAARRSNFFLLLDFSKTRFFLSNEIVDKLPFYANTSKNHVRIL